MLPYVKIYRDFIDIVRELDNGARGRLFMAIMQYANDEEPDPLSGGEKIAFLTIKGQIDRDRDAYDDLVEKRKSAGRRGAERRWDDSENGKCMAKMANANFAINENGKNGKCQQDKDKDKEEDKEEDKDKDNKSATDFDIFWSAYPKKVGKGAAKSAFARVKGVNVQTLLNAIANQKQSQQWKTDNGRYIPNPATWLNQGRWDDVVTQYGEPREKARGGSLEPLKEWIEHYGSQPVSEDSGCFGENLSEGEVFTGRGECGDLVSFPF